MAFPDDPRDVELAIQIGDQWVDAVTEGEGVQQSKGFITASAGRANWGAQADAGTLDFTLDNFDGRWSPRNPESPYFGQFRRNLPTRYGIRHGPTYLSRAGAAQNADVATTPHTANLNTTDIDIRAELYLQEDPVNLARSVTNRARRFLIARKGLPGQGWEWFIFRNESGNADIGFRWRPTAVDPQITFTLGAAGGELSFLINGITDRRFATRFTLDTSAGTGNWFISESLADPFMQIGQQSQIGGVPIGATSILSNTEPLKVGGSTGDFDSQFERLPGRLYGFEMRSAIGGPAVANPTFEGAPAGAATVTDSSRVWAIGAGGRIDNLRWRFHGELASIPSRWSVEGGDVWAPVQAAGLLRRIRRRPETKSPARRVIEATTLAGLIHYWPCEDEGSKALDRFGAVVGEAPLIVSPAPLATDGEPRPAQQDGFLGSLPLPVLGGDRWLGELTPDFGGDPFSWQARWHMFTPAELPDAEFTIFRVDTNELSYVVDIRGESAANGGQMRLRVFDNVTQLYAQPWTGFDLKGNYRRFSLAVDGDGIGAITFQFIGTTENQSVGATGIIDTGLIRPASQIIRLEVNQDGTGSDVSLGHIALFNTAHSEQGLVDEISSFAGELAANRIRRLCDEDGIRSRIYGDAQQSAPMGPQFAGTIGALLTECANTDLGILHESPESIAIAYRVGESIRGQGDRIENEAGAVLWHSAQDLRATDQQTMRNRFPADAGNAVLGPPPAAPVIVLGDTNIGELNRVNADGTDDLIDLDYTPTFDAGAGELTVLFHGYWTTAATTLGNRRLFSFEGANVQSLYMTGSAAAVARPRVEVGGAGGFVGLDVAPATDLVDGQPFVAAAILDAGTLRGYLLGQGITAGSANYSGVGAISHGAGKLFERSIGGNNLEIGFGSVMIIERALAEPELDEIAGRLIDDNQLGVFALDFTDGEIAGVLEPEEDDASLANDITVKNAQGGIARAVLDDDSPLSIAEPPIGAGRYPRSVTVSAPSANLQDLAGRLLDIGTVNEPRVSRLPIGLNYREISGQEAMVTRLLELRLGDLVTVDRNLPQWDPGQIAQVVQGWTQTTGGYSDLIQLLTDSAFPFRFADVVSGSGPGPQGPQPLHGPPDIPLFDANPFEITTAMNFATEMSNRPAGSSFLLMPGVHTPSDVRVKGGSHIRLAAGAIMEGNGSTTYFMRPIDQNAHNIVIGGDPSAATRPVIRNFGENVTGDFPVGRTAAITTYPEDTAAGTAEYAQVDDMFIYGLELDRNGGAGVQLGDRFTVFNCEIHDHKVSAMNANRSVAGFVKDCDLHHNALEPSTGSTSNGGNIKCVWHNSDLGADSRFPRRNKVKGQFVVSTTNFDATARGTHMPSKVTAHGMWFDLDCQDVFVEHSTFDGHTNSSIFFEGCNGGEAAFNTVRNCPGHDDGQNAPPGGNRGLNANFVNGALCAAESTNIYFHDNLVEDCERGMIQRMSNRTADWLNPGSAERYGLPAGGRYYLLDTQTIPPAPPNPLNPLSGGNLATPNSVLTNSNVWTGNNRFERNKLVRCGRVYINEGTNTTGQTVHGSTPIATIGFTGNDYSESPGLLFYDRSNTALSLAQWQALGRQ